MVKDDNAFSAIGFDSAFNGLNINSSATSTAINKHSAHDIHPSTFMSWSSKKQTSNDLDIVNFFT